MEDIPETVAEEIQDLEGILDVLDGLEADSLVEGIPVERNLLERSLAEDSLAAGRTALAVDAETAAAAVVDIPRLASDSRQTLRKTFSSLSRSQRVPFSKYAC